MPPLRQLFQGDSAGARCMEPPYTLLEGAEDVQMELQLPFWIEAADVKVDITAAGVDITVRLSSPAPPGALAAGSVAVSARREARSVA